MDVNMKVDPTGIGSGQGIEIMLWDVTIFYE